MFLFVVIGIVFFAVQKNSSKIPAINKLQITTSFYPMYFFASQIGGEKAQVYNITPASSEPHDYEPTTQDVARISESSMVVLNGGNLETWGNKIKDELQGSSVLIVTAGEGLADRQLTENGQTVQDPHVWLDPVLAKKEVKVIEQGYEKIDPKDKAYFQANTKKLAEQLDGLDKEFRQGLGDCRQKDFITSHAAFGYLAAHYGITQIAISGISPDEEPSSQKLAEIADLVKKEHITTIFFERLVSPKLSETLAQETGATTLVLDPIEGIPQEDLNSGKNYFTVMRDNLFALQKALQCTK